MAMTFSELIKADCVAFDLNVSSKKQLFQDLSRLLIKSDAGGAGALKVRDIVSAAMERERLGSTGVGAGVALPHARLDGITKVHAAFARLETPLDYDSVDDRPVDLVVMLIAPRDAGGDHLRALAQISRRLRREDVRTRLRAAPTAESLYVTLMDVQEASAA